MRRRAVFYRPCGAEIAELKTRFKAQNILVILNSAFNVRNMNDSGYGQYCHKKDTNIYVQK
jgi:hypothetical protein